MNKCGELIEESSLEQGFPTVNKLNLVIKYNFSPVLPNRVDAQRMQLTKVPSISRVSEENQKKFG